jgi:hypothetical protein
MQRGFEPEWQRRDGREGRAVVARLALQEPQASPAVVVGLSGQELVGRTLPAGEIWRYPSAPNVLPSISSGTIAFTAGSNLIVLEATRGDELFRVPSYDRRLEGYSFDGAHGVFLLVDQNDARPDLIAILDRRGKVVSEVQTLARVGTPLALGGLALVPWANQYVSAFDLGTGSYAGRLVARSAPNRVIANKTGVFLTGGGGTVQLDARLADNPDLKPITFSTEHLPGQPECPIDGSKPRVAKNAPISALFEPTLVDGQVRFAAGQVVVTYYQLVAGLSAEGQTPLWVNHFSHNVVGGDANLKGALFCLEDGVVEFASYEAGYKEAVSSLGARLQACAVDAGNLEGRALPRPRTETQIVEALGATGPSLGAFHDFLLKELGATATREATAALLAIARDPATPSPLLLSARKELEKRETGLDLLLAAVIDSANRRGPANNPETSKDAITRPVPIAELARALGRKGERAAAAPLARHLPSADLSADEAVAIIEALLSIGGEAEVPYVYDFLVANKNVATNAQFALALEGATRFLVRQGGSARQEAKAAIDESMTHPDLKLLLEKSYEAELAPKK